MATGDARAAWITDDETETTAHVPDQGTGQLSGTVTGDPRAASVGAHAGEVETVDRQAKVGQRVTPTQPTEDISPQEQADIRRAIAESLRDQGAEDSGDPRASWLEADTAHGGRHNWSKKSAPGKPGPIEDPRAF